MSFPHEQTGNSEKILTGAAGILRKWNRSGLTLDDCIDDLRKTDLPVRSVTSILFLYFRHKSLIDGLLLKAAARGVVKEPFASIAACALTQALFQTGIVRESAVNIAVDAAKRENPRAAGFVNALLRNVLRTVGPGPFPGSFPEELRKRWEKTFPPEETAEAVEACGTNPPLSFRLRRGAGLPEELAGECVKTESPAGLFPFYLCEQPEPLLKSALFREGGCYIQDPATELSISLCGELPEKARILDACAAPGGKTVMLADRYPDAEITAADRSERRIAQMRENFERMRVAAKTVAADALKPPFAEESFDLVFVDAPCSNTGVARRRPDALWRFREGRVGETAKLQKQILASLAGLVRRGGVLLYSTCSVEEEEDRLQAGDFLKSHPDFLMEESRLLAPSMMNDGAFAVRFRRKS